MSEKITKAALVEELANTTGLSKKASGDYVEALSDLIVSHLKAGEAVALPGIGILSVADTAERQGVRPGTNEKITIPAGKKVRFKVASTLKAAI